MPTWPAPTASGPLDALIELPGSKSLTNRALVLAALADSPSRLRRPLRARDTLLMVAGLHGLGAQIADAGDDWLVTPGTLRGPASVDCGLAGTVMRFLPPVAALAMGDVAFDGDPHARTRPMRPVLEGLRDLGADIDDDGRGVLPFTVRGRGVLRGGDVGVDASASSQFVSALLLVSPRFEHGLDVRHVSSTNATVPSLPHIDMTLDLLRTVGVDAASTGPTAWHVTPGPIHLGDFDIEPDLSNAAPFLAAALVTGGTVRMAHWPARSTQPGIALPDLFRRMGADVTYQPSSSESGTLTVNGNGTITGLDADLSAVGELTPTLAALAALADSPSQLRGVAHLRGHETDRLVALRTELTKLGADVTETADGLDITPGPLIGCRFETYADHRMATAGALIGLAVPGVQVVDIETTGKTLPQFVQRWTGLLHGTSVGSAF